NTWRCSSATKRQALRQPEERFVQRDTCRCLRRSTFCAARNQRGLSIISASLVTAKDSKPTSMPTTESFSGSGSVFTMHEKQAYHFPFSFLSVSVFTSPAIGRCRFTFTLPILDSDSCEPLTLNPSCG